METLEDLLCGGDTALLEQVQSLLASHRGVGSFLKPPGIEVAAPAAGISVVPRARLSITGMVISHYRVLDPLGSGGMEVVYKAESTLLGRLAADSPSPYRRQHGTRESKLGIGCTFG